MSVRFRSIILLILISTFVFAACNPATTVPTTTTAPTTAPSATSAPTAAPTSTVAPTATAAPSATTEPTKVPQPTANMTDGCVTNYSPDIDYFPEKATLTVTKGFTVEYFKNYKVVTVPQAWQGADNSFQYVLVQCGTPAPKGFDKAVVIEVPVKKIITMSTSYLPYLDSLGVLDRLVGLDDITYVNNPNVQKMASDGKLKYIGYGSKVNVEQTVDLTPDIVMTYGLGSADYDAYPKLQEAGLKVVLNADYFDPTPLGRAEWGKFIAVFFNKEALAEKNFKDTADHYNQLKEQAAGVKTKPTVFLNTAYKGTWNEPGGKSFMAQFLADAGSAYFWADDTSSGTLFLSFEQVYDKAAKADFWLHPGFMIETLKDLLAGDKRYGDFEAFKKDAVYNNDAAANANGGLDFYESGVAHPDVILADLIKIFHPELLPDYQLVYYHQLKK